MHWKRRKKTRASEQGWQSQPQQFCKNEIEIKQIILKSIFITAICVHWNGDDKSKSSTAVC